MDTLNSIIPSFATFIKFCTSTTVATLAIEHIARKYDIQNRPSKFLNIIAMCSINSWRNIGKLFALASSFFAQIDLDDLCKTITDVATPLVTTISSPIYFIYGYIEKCNSYVRKEWFVPIGSFYILWFAIYLTDRYLGLNMVSKLRQLLKFNN